MYMFTKSIMQFSPFFFISCILFTYMYIKIRTIKQIIAILQNNNNSVKTII